MLKLLVTLLSSASVTASLSFLAVGDWGGLPVPPYYTRGQKQSVDGMNRVAKKLGAEFVLALGDNFYYQGIRSDAYDSRFQETFEDVYTGDFLEVPWYVIAGNHDHYGNVTAQVEYSSTGLSSRWTFPSEFYTKSFTSDDGVTVDIVFIDTIELAGSSDLPEGHPDYFAPLPPRARASASASWDWIEQQLSSSTAQHLLVAGHYPVYSACDHGNTQNLVDNLLPLLEKYEAHYFSGHDHCMEHISEPGSKVHHILSGMGQMCCYKSDKKDLVPVDSLQWYIAIDNRPRGVTAGFSSVVVSSTGLTVSHHDQDGKVLYTTPVIPKRSI